MELLDKNKQPTKYYFDCGYCTTKSNGNDFKTMYKEHNCFKIAARIDGVFYDYCFWEFKVAKSVYNSIKIRKITNQ